MKPNALLVILGNQLFAPKHLPGPDDVRVFMAEDVGLCTYERHHQQKIVLFLAAMRAYAGELEEAGYRVDYVRLDPDDARPYEDKLEQALGDDNELIHFEIEDKPMEQRVIGFAERHGLQRRELTSPMFTCTREEFAAWSGDRSTLLMADFYTLRRRELGILVSDDGEPEGGRWSFDADNRKRLPKTITPPPIPWVKPDQPTRAVIELVSNAFSDHPGDASDFGWPTTRRQARQWLADFIDNRLEHFGPYEDALAQRSATVFHSLLSPYLNMGLLTPREVLEQVLAARDGVPLQSLEGFVRQVIGWREFVRGVYRQFSEVQATSNHWSHDRELADSWYAGTTGIPPLDDTIRQAQRCGWTHHIPRLMVLGNLMTLCEIRPQAAHRWFMEMYVDSSEWVMGPNVFGMGLFSDGGIFATKPYICGSNYLLKMSDYGKEEWCDTVDGLYWRFIDKHRDFFAANPRLALMPRALERLNRDRRDRIFRAAADFLDAHTRHA
ncbi:MAG: cryptochrome/photolyase family protein [Woeseiaceae bacterium]